MNQTINEQRFMLEVDGYQIPGALTLPEDNPNPTWAILLIPGSLFMDVDGNFPAWNIFPHTYADLANQLGELGHTVLRFAKTGPGTGSLVVDGDKAKVYRNFGQRVVVAEQAHRTLQDKVPRAKAVAVAGHSEGGLVGSLLCHKLGAEVAAFIDLSGPAYPIFDIMLKQNEALAGGNPQPEMRAAIEHWRRGETLPAELLANPQLVQMAGFLGEDGLHYLREQDALDPIELVAQVPCPTLIVQGGLDHSVTPEQADLLVAARNPANTARLFLPELQHFYKVAEPGMTGQESFALSGPTDQRVSKGISQWLTTLSAQPATISG